MDDEAPKNVIHFASAKGKFDKPDPEYVRYDDFGRPMHLFLLEYQMDGQDWGAEVWAYHLNDAKKRVDAMRKSLSLIGMAFAKLPF